MVGLVAPRINMNGTSRGALRKQYEDAYRAVQKAMGVVSESAPHARDYQTYQTVDFYVAARDQHRARISKLRDVLDELELILTDIDDWGR